MNTHLQPRDNWRTLPEEIKYMIMRFVFEDDIWSTPIYEEVDLTQLTSASDALSCPHPLPSTQNQYPYPTHLARTGYTVPIMGVPKQILQTACWVRKTRRNPSSRTHSP
jgi:hypothetical protein